MLSSVTTWIIRKPMLQPLIRKHEGAVGGVTAPRACRQPGASLRAGRGPGKPSYAICKYFTGTGLFAAFASAASTLQKDSYPTCPDVAYSSLYTFRVNEFATSRRMKRDNAPNTIGFSPVVIAGMLGDR